MLYRKLLDEERRRKAHPFAGWSIARLLAE
jgi:hypothetical protein